MKTVCLLVATMVFSFSAQAQRGGRARAYVERIKREIESGRSGQRVVQEQKRFEDQMVRKLRSSSGLSSRELNNESLKKFVEKHSESSLNVSAIESLLEGITARGNVVPAQQKATAKLLGLGVKLSNRRGGFSLEPRDMLDIHRNWRTSAKEQLADILLETQSILASSPRMSSNKAFEKALENRGLKEKFNRRCR